MLDVSIRTRCAGGAKPLAMCGVKVSRLACTWFAVGIAVRSRTRQPREDAMPRPARALTRLARLGAQLQGLNSAAPRCAPPESVRSWQGAHCCR